MRPLPWLANPGNEPPRGREVRRAPVTLVKQWKEREGREGGNILEDVLPRKTLTINTIPVMAANTSQSGILTHAQTRFETEAKGNSERA